ncbi:hypothetical protein BH11ACT6_BH11ACT6_09620 [soil metagenome]
MIDARERFALRVNATNDLNVGIAECGVPVVNALLEHQDYVVERPRRRVLR